MRTILPALIIAVLAAGPAAAGQDAARRVALPVVKIWEGKACVAPAAEMRRDHMRKLLHQRDRTVHDGIRRARFSLKRCVECHADRETGSVLGPEGFCSSCHAYASVRIDCFECHTPLRQARTAAKP